MMELREHVPAQFWDTKPYVRMEVPYNENVGMAAFTTTGGMQSVSYAANKI